MVTAKTATETARLLRAVTEALPPESSAELGVARFVEGAASALDMVGRVSPRKPDQRP